MVVIGLVVFFFFFFVPMVLASAAGNGLKVVGSCLWLKLYGIFFPNDGGGR